MSILKKNSGSLPAGGAEGSAKKQVKVPKRTRSVETGATDPLKEADKTAAEMSNPVKDAAKTTEQIAKPVKKAAKKKPTARRTKPAGAKSASLTKRVKGFVGNLTGTGEESITARLKRLADNFQDPEESFSEKLKRFGKKIAGLPRAARAFFKETKEFLISLRKMSPREILDLLKRNKRRVAYVAGAFVALLFLFVFVFPSIKTSKRATASRLAPSVIKESKAGDPVTFGGSSWKILTVDKDRALILSETCIDTMPYHSADEEVTWETSSIREYLNSEFLERFSAAEQGLIIRSTVKAEDNRFSGIELVEQGGYTDVEANGDVHVISGGNDTEDKIFLLSIAEVMKYVKESPYSGTDEKLLSEMPDWYLRTPGVTNDKVAYVTGGTTTVDRFGAEVSPDKKNQQKGIRPALWIRLNDHA